MIAITAEPRTVLLLCPELAGIPMEPEEFDAVEDAEEGYRYELINGVLVVTPPPAEGERVPNDVLGHWLYEYRERHPQGSALDATAPEQTIVTPRRRRQADRAIWAGLGRLPDPKADLPAIVVEFVSLARRDYVAKRQEYLEAGVSEYWIFDRFRRQMTVVRRRAEGPEEIAVAAGDVYRTPLLLGFELPLARLLAVADDWAGPKRE